MLPARSFLGFGSGSGHFWVQVISGVGSGHPLQLTPRCIIHALLVSHHFIENNSSVVVVGSMWLTPAFKVQTLSLHLKSVQIIPSQMEVAPLHCTVDITQKRRLFKNTKEIEKM